jgi:putative colanic acid biosynthesis UDP-glucose lipid carrier transferase
LVGIRNVGELAMRLTGNAHEYASVLVFFMRLLDAGLIFASGLGCFYLLEPLKSFPDYTGLMPRNYLMALGVTILLSAWWFPVFNVYRSWRGSSLFSEIRLLACSWLTTIVGLTAFIFFTKSADDFSRHWLGLWFLSAFMMMTFARLFIRSALRQARQHGLNLRHVVIVGNGKKSTEITNHINAAPWLGLSIKGYFDTVDNADNSPDNATQLGLLEQFIPYLEKHPVDQVWIALSLREIETIETLCQQLEQMAVEVLLVPDISGWRLLNHSIVQVNGMPFISIAVSPIKGSHVIVKWLEDKILALLILIVISPLLVLIALAIKATSKGSVFYCQDRVSWNGKHFKMLKFRTLPADSDTKEGQPVWGQIHAKKPTRLGAFLRRTSLDELPQFINVLKGDMSIVGPRPERPMFVEQFRHEIDRYMQKHLVKAGITGWAQVNGWRGETCLTMRVQHDLYYIENWSLWLDLKIIVLTLFRGFVHKNAY